MNVPTLDSSATWSPALLAGILKASSSEIRHLYESQAYTFHFAVILPCHRATEVIISFDTHQDQHVSVAIDGRGFRSGVRHVPTTIGWYVGLERWSRNLGEIIAFAIEGTGVARFMAGRSRVERGVKADPRPACPPPGPVRRLHAEGIRLVAGDMLQVSRRLVAHQDRYPGGCRGTDLLRHRPASD